MVGEVNKIIYNLLVSGKDVCIGGVGTLVTMRYAAHRASRKSMTPPYRIVIFTTEQRGESLEGEIARVADVDAEKAHEIFERWLSAVSDGETLKIEGVGILRRDKFLPEETFIDALNPLGRAPIRLKPKTNVWLYIFASVCVLFALIVAGYVYVDSRGIELFGGEGRVDDNASVVEKAEPEPIVASESSTIEIVDSVMIAQPVEEHAHQVQVREQEVVDTDSRAILSTESGYSYVVLGVFSTIDNAERAIRDAQKQDGALQCSVYHYGNKFMVALHEAPSRSECQEFARSLGDKFKDLWIYSRK